MVVGLCFALLMMPMVFQHNADLGLVTAVFIDSGSLLNDYLKMAGSPTDLNQNVQYHAGFYGWVYNTLITMGIVGIQSVSSALGNPADFASLATFARSVSLILTACGLPALYLLTIALGAPRWMSVLFVLVVGLFPPFIKFAYEIHPKFSGFLFSTLTLLFAVSCVSASRDKPGHL